MKTTATVTITREKKNIIIYVDDGDWSKVPDLTFIADVEVAELAPAVPEIENPNFFRWFIEKMRL